MTGSQSTGLSRRERQVMEALYRLRRATVMEIVEAMTEDVTYSSVRAVLRELKRKGQVQHRQDGPRYVYRPVLPPERARTRALNDLVSTFFGGSPEAAAVTLLRMADMGLPEEDIARIEARIRDARKEGR